MELQGKIIVKGGVQTVGSNNFEKQLLVIETDEQYPQKIGIDFVQGKGILMDDFLIGEKVKVSVNVRGQEYNGKYYVSFQGWKIEKQ